MAFSAAVLTSPRLSISLREKLTRVHQIFVQASSAFISDPRWTLVRKRAGIDADLILCLACPTATTRAGWRMPAEVIAVCELAWKSI